MPEFLFRRRNRRAKDANNDTAQEPEGTVQGSKEPTKKKQKDKIASKATSGAIPASTITTAKEVERNDSVLREKEEFMALYKNKYPEDAARLGLTNRVRGLEVGGAAQGGVAMVNGEEATMSNHVNGSVDHLVPLSDDPDGLLNASSSDETSHDQSHDSSDGFIKTTSTAELPSITTSPRKISKYDECLFLRYRKAIRRCPMPSPITLSTLKNLFINMFDLSPTLLDNPSCALYIQDKKSQHQWEPLSSMSMVTDHCTLQLKDRSSKRSHHKRFASQGDAPDIDTPLELSANLKTPPQKQKSSESQRSLDSKTVEKSSLGGGSIGPLFKAGSQTSVHQADKTTPTTTKATPTTAELANKLNSLWNSGQRFEVDNLTSLSDNHPLHQQQTSSGSDVIMTSPFSITSSTSGVYSDQPIDQKRLSSMAHSLKSSVKKLKSDMAELRQDHIHQASSFSLSLLQTKQKIISGLCAAISMGRLGSSAKMMENFRRDRLKLYSMKQDYDKKSIPTLQELELLESAVEGMRIDVVDRRCRVSETEVKELTSQVSAVSKTLKQLEALYVPLEDMMKHVMEKELQIIVKEEKFVEEEGPRLDEAVDKCLTLQTTLNTLNRYAVVQTHRTPLIPYFTTELEPDRDTLFENIQAIHPNHKHRAKELKKAEVIIQRRKEYMLSTKVALKEFEKELQTKRQSLRHVKKFSDIENRQLLKTKEIFLKEKDMRKKQLEEELQIRGRLALKKREQEKKQLMQWQPDELPPPGPVRKTRSHVSINSVQDEGDADRDRYGIPIHSCRSDGQILSHFAPLKNGRVVTPMHVADDHKRHSVHLGEGFSLAPAPKDHQGMFQKPTSYSQSGRLMTSSTYDSLAQVQESYNQLESGISSNSSRAKSSTIGHGHQLNVHQSTAPLATASTASVSSGSSNASNSSTGAWSMQVTSGSAGGQSVNLQALTMLPSRGATGGTNYSSRMKEPSPLVTKRIDAKSGSGGAGQGNPRKAQSDFTPQSSSSVPSGKKKSKKSQPYANGLPSRYQMHEHNSQPDSFTYGYNDIMEHSSLSQPVEGVESLPYPRTAFSPDFVPLRSGERSRQSSKSFYRSASDESVYDTMRTSSRGSRPSSQAKEFNVKESRSWAKSFALSVFNSFSSSDKVKNGHQKSKNGKQKHQKYRKEQNSGAAKGGGHSMTLGTKRDQSLTAGSKGSHSATMSGSGHQSRYHHTYSHHSPKSFKSKSGKKSLVISPDDQVEHKSVRFMRDSTSYQQNLPLPMSAPPPLPDPSSHSHDTQMSTRSSAPSLTVLSTQSPGMSSNMLSSDVRLTSYPTSYTLALQQRRNHTGSTAASMRPQSNFMGRGAAGGWAYHERQYPQNGPFKSSLSNGNLTDVAKLGSLV